eukprot:TRINITY_DN12864_c0_g2_i1.p4 TRINITY_DN12864_c0_g2~~TRINITY_DN12864_c0_g2_i1.p4  ORF type:complete len:205 (+),score=-13.37 TRINITY_DN12864_c0_g2_i1:758-1372(+)
MDVGLTTPTQNKQNNQVKILKIHLQDISYHHLVISLPNQMLFRYEKCIKLRLRDIPGNCFYDKILYVQYIYTYIYIQARALIQSRITLIASYTNLQLEQIQKPGKAWNEYGIYTCNMYIYIHICMYIKARALVQSRITLNAGYTNLQLEQIQKPGKAWNEYGINTQQVSKECGHQQYLGLETCIGVCKRNNPHKAIQSQRYFWQ